VEKAGSRLEIDTWQSYIRETNPLKGVMGKQKTSYNPATGKATYGKNAHLGEVRFGTKVINDSIGAYGQKLASTKGLDGARNLLKGRYQKKS
jgi:hypothetical protein